MRTCVGLLSACTTTVLLFVSVYFIQHLQTTEAYHYIDYRSDLLNDKLVQIPSSAPRIDVPKSGSESPKTKKMTFIPTKITPVNEEKLVQTDSIVTSEAAGTTTDTMATAPEVPPLLSSSDDTTGEADYTDAIYFKVDVPASYQGGMASLDSFLRANIQYPAYALQNAVHGIIYIRMLIRYDGTPTEIELDRGIENSCNEEVLRVMRTMPNWIPARKQGKRVSQRIVLPVPFNAP